MEIPKLLFGLCIGSASLGACTDSADPAVELPQLTVPIEIVNNRPLVKVRINGIPVSVLFDLGNSDNLLLFPAVLNGIDKIHVGESDEYKTVHEISDGKPIYQVDLVQIGDLSFTDVKIIEDFHDAEYQADFVANLDAYGTVGTGLFQDYKLVFDYQNDELTIIKPDASGQSQSKCHGREIPFLPGSDAGILTMAKTEIGDIKFVWDTGAIPNIILKNRAESEHLELSDRNTVTLDQIAFGEHEFGPIEFKVWDFPVTPPFDGFIGHVFFRDHIVCVDFPRDRLLIPE